MKEWWLFWPLGGCIRSGLKYGRVAMAWCTYMNSSELERIKVQRAHRLALCRPLLVASLTNEEGASVLVVKLWVCSLNCISSTDEKIDTAASERATFSGVRWSHTIGTKWST